MNKALFLDRDGVVNKEKNYLYKIADFEFIDGVFETCRYFQEKGYLIIIVTNQAGIARKIYSEKDFGVLTDWMLHQFLIEGIKINAIYHCPHHPNFTGPCECRKPKPGMLLRAQKEFCIDMDNSILVGDKLSDIKAGINAGIKNNYIIATGHSHDAQNIPKKMINNLYELVGLLE